MNTPAASRSQPSEANVNSALNSEIGGLKSVTERTENPTDAHSAIAPTRHTAAPART
jgi:hypothetical protein